MAAFKSAIDDQLDAVDLDPVVAFALMRRPRLSIALRAASAERSEKPGM